MFAKYFSIIRNYVLSVSLQRNYNLYHQNTFLDAFPTNSRNIIGRNPSMVIPLLANQDLTPMLIHVPCFRFWIKFCLLCLMSLFDQFMNSHKAQFHFILGKREFVILIKISSNFQTRGQKSMEASHFHLGEA